MRLNSDSFDPTSPPGPLSEGVETSPPGPLSEGEGENFSPPRISEACSLYALIVISQNKRMRQWGEESIYR